jgi:heme exporter protein A
VRYLSAGQKRRVSLVHVLISKAPLWIMDEPFSNLDEQGKHYLARKLAEHLADGGLAVLAAHHELELEHGLVRRLELGEVQ